MLASNASASQLVDRNASAIKLEVNAKGEALISYKAHGEAEARARLGRVERDRADAGAAAGRVQARLRRRLGQVPPDYWKTFKNSCGAYDGPKLAWFVAGCTAPDGSYWALQAWQRMLPNYGVTATAAQSVWELRLSHWTGDLPVLTINTDWAWHQWDHLFGTFTYNGQPVFGYKATPGGNPLDTFGRNIYVEPSTRPTARAGCARTAS